MSPKQGPHWRGRIGLFARVAAATARILLDRVDEARGRALPRTAEQLARADTLNELLQEHAPDSGVALPSVRSARLPGIDFESSNCTNFLVEVEFDKDGFDPKALPSTLYAKLPCAEFGTRAFANAVGFWEVEASFCERVASRLPIRVPRVYAVARRGARFVLLLENLNATPGTRLFINRDMAAGTTPERARMCIRTFAELHAAFWELPTEQREALQPARLHTYLAPGGRALTRSLNSLAIEPAHAKAPEIFRKQHVDICKRAVEKWDALVDHWFSEPLTLIHGDSHLANCFEYESHDGPRMGMLDFQGTHWGHGVRDLQYFLINSLEPDVLAECEGELIDAYLAELSLRGISLDAKTAHEQYCALSFQTLMVAVTSLGLGSLTERDTTVRTVLRRSVAAIDRLGFGDWLTQL